MKKYNIFIILIFFLFIYNPPILQINILHILGAFSWIYILLNIKTVSNIFNTKKLVIIYVLLVYLFIYLLSIALLNGNSITSSFSFIFWIIDILPISIALTTYMTRNKYNIYDFLKLLLIIATLQGITAILAFYIPEVKDIFVSRLVAYGYSDIFIQLSDFRMYGFASNLTYSTPIVQSTIGMISIYLALNKNWKYIVFAPLILFSAIINARTSFVIIIIGLLALAITTKKINIKGALKVIVLGLLLALSINVSLTVLKNNANDTYEWVTKGFHEIVEVLTEGTNQSEGYFSYVSNPEKYELPPNGLELIFGVGTRVLNKNDYNAHSDIGYINDIWLGGLFYTLILYILFLKILMDIYNENKIYGKLSKYTFWLFIGIFIVTNIKGYIFGMNNFTNLFILVYVFISLRKPEFVVKENKVP